MNTFYYIFLVDIVLIVIFCLIGKYAIEKESKDIYKGKKTIESRKSLILAKEWEKMHPILDFFQNFYYECNRKSKIPADTHRKRKWDIKN